MGPGPYDSWNPEEDWTDWDDWDRGPREPDYGVKGSSDLPRDDQRETDAHDWGLGFGANGEGVEPEKVGPRSNLPGADNGPPGDTIEHPHFERLGEWMPEESVLPGDLDWPVARSHYYDGLNGDIRRSTELPEEEPWGTPEEAVVPRTTADPGTWEVYQDINTPYLSYTDLLEPSRGIK